jgi:hypothetical protein
MDRRLFVNGRGVRKSTKQTTRSKAMEVGVRMKDQEATFGSLDRRRDALGGPAAWPHNRDACGCPATTTFRVEPEHGIAYVAPGSVPGPGKEIDLCCAPDQTSQGTPKDSSWDTAAEALFLSKAEGISWDVFVILMDSGMRPDEVLRLRKKDILWEKALIRVPLGKTKRSTRYVPLSDRVRDILTRRSSWNEYVFPARRKSGHKSHTAIEKPFRISAAS